MLRRSLTAILALATLLSIAVVSPDPASAAVITSKCSAWAQVGASSIYTRVCGYAETITYNGTPAVRIVGREEARNGGVKTRNVAVSHYVGSPSSNASKTGNLNLIPGSTRIIASQAVLTRNLHGTGVVIGTATVGSCYRCSGSVTGPRQTLYLQY